MISSVSNNLSALRAFGEKMGVTANNLANVETEEFKKSRALIKEGSNGDVEVDILGIDTPGDIRIEVKDGRVEEKEMSNVDPAEEITETIVTQRSYEANLAAIRTQDDMLGSVIDILG